MSRSKRVKKIRKNDKRKKFIIKQIRNVLEKQNTNELLNIFGNIAEDYTHRSTTNDLLKEFGNVETRPVRRKSKQYYLEFEPYRKTGPDSRARGGIRIAVDGVNYNKAFSNSKKEKINLTRGQLKQAYRSRDSAVSLADINNMLGFRLDFKHPLFSSGDWVFLITTVTKQTRIQPTPLNERLLRDNTKKIVSSKYQEFVRNENAQSLKELVVVQTYADQACWIDIIIGLYKKSFPKYCKKFKLTVDNIASVMGRKFQPDGSPDYAYTIDEAVVFFKRFRLILECYDTKGKLIHSYYPLKKDGSRFKQKMHCKTVVCISNGHVYKMNRLLKHLEQRIKRQTNKVSIKLSNEFRAPKDTVENEREFFIVKNKDDLIQKVVTANGGCDIIFIGCLKAFVVELFKCGIAPEIRKVVSKEITSISLDFDTGVINISNQIFNNIPDEDIESMTKEQYTLYKKLKSKLYSTIVKGNTSYYSEHLTEIFDEYSRYSLVNAMGEKLQSGECLTNQVVYEIDDCKAYTSTLKNLKEYGQFTSNDRFVRYSGEKIQYSAFYIVKRPDKMSEKLKLLFDRDYNLLCGMSIIELEKTMKLNIKSVIYPYKVIKSKAPEVIDEIFYSDLPVYLKKFACNQTIGAIGKKYNKRQFSILTDSKDEIADFEEMFDDQTNAIEYTDYCDELMIGDITYQERLNGGFYHLQHMVYCYQRIKLYNSALMAENCGGRVVGCKTDAVYFTGGEPKKIEHLCDGKFGGKKLTPKKYIWNHENLLEVKENHGVKIKSREQNIINILDEWDEGLMMEKLKCGSVHLTADYPGCGKSYALKKLESVLVVCPYRRLCFEYIQEGIDAITLDSFLGISFNNENEYLKGKDISAYKNIVFDEINCHSIYKLQKLHNYIRKQNDIFEIAESLGDTNIIKFYCAGDYQQIENIDGDNALYINSFIETIFPNRIHLREIKRQDNLDDILKIKEIKRLLFETETPIFDILKLLNCMTLDEIKQDPSKINICYLNDSCNKVNNIFSNGIAVGETVISKRRYKFKGGLINTNYLYKIKKLDKENITITEGDNIEMIIPRNSCRDLFKPAYSFTAHSVQGLSFNENVTIFDSHLQFVSREWLWVALTRVRSLSMVRICTDKIAGDDIKNLGSKIQSYKETDSKKGCNFKINKLVTKKEIRTKIVNQLYSCYYCRSALSLNYTDGDLMQWSVDRLDNAKFHTNENTCISCLSCNHSKQ